MDDFDILAFPTNHHSSHLPYTSFFHHHGKTNPTNPHGEPTCRKNWTAGKSPASELPAACKLPAARKPAAARKATAASPSHGDSKKFSGVTGKREEVVTLPKEPVNGSHVGMSTCGAAPTNARCCVSTCLILP